MAATGNNMNNLTTLIKRLEAATSRLEDIASSSPGPAPSVNGVPPDALANVVAAGASSAVPEPAPQPLPPAIEDFDVLINQDVKDFVRLSDELGGLVSEQAASVLKAFNAERKFLVITTKAKKPEIQSPIYMEILKELQSTVGAVNDVTTANRGSPLFNHLSTVSEGIAMLVWITVEPKPAPYVAETLSSAQYWGNRVLKEYKDRNHLHVEWAQAFTRIFKSLTNYIKQHYATGLTWNKDGVDAAEALKQVDSGQIFSNTPPAPPAPPTSSGAPPPPPPPPPLPTFDNAAPTNGVASSRSAGANDMGAVFEQISKGESVTANLRKVDPSSQTHKNPSLRAGATVPPTRSDSQSSTTSRGKSPVPGKKPKPESMRTKKPPRKELDGNKWIIENFDSEPMIEIEASITHSILISRCSKTTIRVLNKANAISLDNSSQVSLIVDSLVSSVDVIKSPRFALQVLGALPTLLLDQVDGATVYLGKESLHTEIFTSKCAAINVNVPEASDEGDYKENPLPEQIKSVIRNGKLVSEIVEHAG